MSEAGKIKQLYGNLFELRRSEEELNDTLKKVQNLRIYIAELRKKVGVEEGEPIEKVEQYWKGRKHRHGDT